MEEEKENKKRKDLGNIISKSARVVIGSFIVGIALYTYQNHREQLAYQRGIEDMKVQQIQLEHVQCSVHNLKTQHVLGARVYHSNGTRSELLYAYHDSDSYMVFLQEMPTGDGLGSLNQHSNEVSKQPQFGGF